MTTLETIERDKLHKSFSELLATEAGRRVIFWTLEQCAIYREAYTGDDAATNYTLGMQASGRKVIAEIDAINPRFYPQLLLDMAELRDRDRAAAEQADNPEDDDDDY